VNHIDAAHSRYLKVRERTSYAFAVVSAAASLRMENGSIREARLALGGVAAKPWRARAAELVLTGAKPDPAAFQRAADVVIQKSLREGFGLVVLEALACGTPVVASKIAPFTEYLDDSTCAWAVPTDPASIAAALERVANGRFKPDFRQAVPALLQRMSWQASAQRHLDIYRDLPTLTTS